MSSTRDGNKSEEHVVAGIERGLADMRAGRSKVLETSAERAAREAEEQAWLRENAESIRAHNERIDKYGTLLKPIWLED